MYQNISDIYLAGYLIASGFPLASHRKDQAQTIFCFEETDRLIQLVEDYYNLKASINPLHYGGALKILKNIVYQKDKHYNNYDNQRMFNKSERV